MSEYPWGIENMMLGQHEQPCDCAICDEIWYNREVRRNRRKNVLDEVTRLKAALDAAERQRDDKWIETGLFSEKRRNDLLSADIKRLQQDLCMWQEMYNEIDSRLKVQQEKCNIYKCMDRKDLKLRIEQLERDYESLKAENAELRGINQSLSVDWVKHSDMQSALEFFARLDKDMLIIDINRIARKALRMEDI